MLSRDQTKPLTGRTVFLWLVAFFGIVLVVNGVMAKLAIDTLPGTEVDSAYSASLAYNSEITAAHDQEERGWQVAAHIERYSDGHASIKLQAHDGNGAPITGMAFSALLERPTDKRADRFIALIDNGNGVYRGDAYDVTPGQWDMVLVAERNAHRLFRSKNRVVLR
jgi:nitrogen fixation protein FixH